MTATCRIRCVLDSHNAALDRLRILGVRLCLPGSGLLYPTSQRRHSRQAMHSGIDRDTMRHISA